MRRVEARPGRGNTCRWQVTTGVSDRFVFLILPGGRATAHRNGWFRLVSPLPSDFLFCFLYEKLRTLLFHFDIRRSCVERLTIDRLPINAKVIG